MRVLNFTSCMAPNADFLCEALANYVGDRLSIPASFINHIPWQEREQQFNQGQLPVCWICGLPYVQEIDRGRTDFELLAAPVFRDDRYQNRPIYFSDVVVQQNSPFFQFADLRGTVWAYNEPRSHSGYYVTCAYLAELGEGLNYFKQFIPSGAHQTSLQWLIDGKIDASAIDSTVLATELRNNPSLQSKIRTIATLGPSPAPPWLMSKVIPKDLRQKVRSLFLTLHTEPQFQTVLETAGVSHFTTVTDRDYNPIRKMAHLASRVIQPDVL